MDKTAIVAELITIYNSLVDRKKNAPDRWADVWDKEINYYSELICQASDLFLVEANTAWFERANRLLDNLVQIGIAEKLEGPARSIARDYVQDHFTEIWNECQDLPF